MAIRSAVQAVMAAACVFALGACGNSAPVDQAQFDEQIIALADAGDVHAEIFLALAERRPELYREFRKVALQAYGNSGSAERAGYVAGAHLRPKLVEELMSMARTTSDEHASEMIDVMIATYRHLNEEDPQSCASLLKGEPLESYDALPSDLRNREARLIAAMFRDETTARDRRAASFNEVTNWMNNVSQLDKDMGKGLGLMSKDKLNKDEAKLLCNSTIELYKRLSYKRLDSRGTLFRGMVLIALQEADKQASLDAET